MMNAFKNICSEENCLCKILICCDTNDYQQLCMSPSCLHPAYNHHIQPRESLEEEGENEGENKENEEEGEEDGAESQSTESDNINFCSVENCLCEVLICCNTDDGTKQLCMSPSCLHPANKHRILQRMSKASDYEDTLSTEELVPCTIQFTGFTPWKGSKVFHDVMTKKRDKPDSEYITKSSYKHVNDLISRILEFRKNICNYDLRLKTIQNLRVWLETNFKDKEKTRGGACRDALTFVVTPSGIGAGFIVKIKNLCFDLSEFEYA